MNLRWKMQLALAGLLVIDGASAGYLVHASRTLHALNIQLFEEAPSADAAEEIERGLERLTRTEGFDTMPRAEDAELAARRRIAESMRMLDEIAVNQRGPAETALIVALRADLLEIKPSALTEPALDAAVRDAALLAELNRQQLLETTQESELFSHEAQRAAALAVVIAILGAFLFFETIWRSISLPLQRVFDAVARIEAGDPNVRVGFVQSDEMGRLGQAIDGMLDSAARRDADKAAFIAGIAHDLRTPLATISIGIDTLKRSLSDPRSEARAEVLERQVTRLDRLLRELLDVARIASGDTAARMETIGLHQIAEDAFALFRESSPLHRFSLISRMAWVRADADLIMRVVVNLLSNAVKYSPDGGTIEIVVSGDGELAELSVRDEGVGIAESARSKVFERFARVDPAGSIPGTGLGLYLARRIVAQHGGILDFESAIGAGSRFFVQLPRAPAPAILARPADEIAH